MQTVPGPARTANPLDFLQAAYGGIIALFAALHLLLEGSVVISPLLTNGIARLLEATYIAHIAAPLLILLLLLHFFLAARRMPLQNGELSAFIRHSLRLKEEDTWLWLVQVGSGMVILVFVFSHILLVMTNLPIDVARSAARLRQGWIFFYALFLPCVILHSGIGAYRIGVKYGFCPRDQRARWRKTVRIAMGCYFVLGLLGLLRIWFLE